MANRLDHLASFYTFYFQKKKINKKFNSSACSVTLNEI